MLDINCKRRRLWRIAQLWWTHQSWNRLFAHSLKIELNPYCTFSHKDSAIGRHLRLNRTPIRVKQYRNHGSTNYTLVACGSMESEIDMIFTLQALDDPRGILTAINLEVIPTKLVPLYLTWQGFSPFFQEPALLPRLTTRAMFTPPLCLIRKTIQQTTHIADVALTPN